MIPGNYQIEDIRAYDEAKAKVASEMNAGDFSTLEEYLVERSENTEKK